MDLLLAILKLEKKKKQNEDDKGNTAHGGEKMGGRER